VLRVVPGLCRQALEAACVSTVRRRRIGRGERHVDVEDAIARATTLKSHLALALFDDASRSGDTMKAINNKFGREAGDIVTDLNKGSHEPIDLKARDLLRGSERLAQEILAL
jgi:hypothetical protein